jgi:hypothetical protein
MQPAVLQLVDDSFFFEFNQSNDAALGGFVIRR